jgi:hypothetical protein
LRKGTNICPPRGKFAFEVLTERIDGHTAESFWYEESADGYQYVRLFDIPGTLSGDILRLRQNLPDIKGDLRSTAKLSVSLKLLHSHPSAKMTPRTSAYSFSCYQRSRSTKHNTMSKRANISAK